MVKGLRITDMRNDSAKRICSDERLLRCEGMRSEMRTYLAEDREMSNTARVR
jgi:hypothetical protein